MGMASHYFDCAIHQRNNQSEVFGVLFIADEAQTSLGKGDGGHGIADIPYTSMDKH